MLKCPLGSQKKVNQRSGDQNTHQTAILEAKTCYSVLFGAKYALKNEKNLSQDLKQVEKYHIGSQKKVNWSPRSQKTPQVPAWAPKHVLEYPL